MRIQDAERKMVDVIRRKRLSLSTERTYCHWLRAFGAWLMRSRATGDARAKMEGFLTWQARRGVAASTQAQAFNALLFFYRDVQGVELGEVRALRAKRPSRVRYCPTREQVRDLLRAVKDVHGYPTRLVCRMLYGCGLRVTEPLGIRIKDLDLANSRVTVREAKGDKDRVVSLPCSLVPELRRQVERSRIVWERAMSEGIPVKLPGHLGRKYPNAARSFNWWWLFPSHTACDDPRDGSRVWWRMHEANVQRAVKEAARVLGLDALLTPHCLRHAYATHTLDAGANVRDVAEAMGHASLETTIVYVHSDALRVRSPLESVEA